MAPEKQSEIERLEAEAAQHENANRNSSRLHVTNAKRSRCIMLLCLHRRKHSR
jgi:hypothetical protein